MNAHELPTGTKIKLTKLSTIDNWKVFNHFLIDKTYTMGKCQRFAESIAYPDFEIPEEIQKLLPYEKGFLFVLPDFEIIPA